MTPYAWLVADLDEIDRSVKSVEGMSTEEIKATLPFDEDKPGFGQFFCHETGRYFIVSRNMFFCRVGRSHT